MPNLSISGNYFRALTDSSHIYYVHSSGCLVLDLAFNEVYNFYLHNINDAYTAEGVPFLYLGTSSGAFTFTKLDDYDSFSGLGLIGHYAGYSDIKSNYVNSVHSIDDFVAFGTSSGVSIVTPNTIFNSLNNFNILKVKLVESGCYYNTLNAFYFKKFPLTQNWNPTYVFSGNINPRFSGNILDFDISDPGIIGLKTSNNTLVIRENITTPSASQVANISYLGSGYNSIFFNDPVVLNGSSLYGSVVLFGSSGIRSIDLSNSGVLDELKYPELMQTNVVDLVFN